MFYADRKGGELMRRGGFVDGAITFMTDDLSDQPSLWQERVLLNEEFYRALRDHPVPLSEGALRAIGPRSMVIDVYIWLAYRLHALKRDVEVGWPAVCSQFGAGFERIRDFRKRYPRMPEPRDGRLPRGAGRHRRARHHPAPVASGNRQGLLARPGSTPAGRVHTQAPLDFMITVWTQVAVTAAPLPCPVRPCGHLTLPDQRPPLQILITASRHIAIYP